MRYRFFAEEKTGPGLIKALVLLILSIQAAASLSRLSLAYEAALRQRAALDSAIAGRACEIAQLQEIAERLTTDQGVAALGYEMGLVFPQDLVFFAVG